MKPKCIPLLLLNLKWSTSYPGCFIPREVTRRNALHRRLGGYQSQSGCFGQQENFLSLPGIETQSFSPQPVHCTDWTVTCKLHLTETLSFSPQPVHCTDWTVTCKLHLTETMPLLPISGRSCDPCHWGPCSFLAPTTQHATRAPSLERTLSHVTCSHRTLVCGASWCMAFGTLICVSGTIPLVTRLKQRIMEPGMFQSNWY
jgi:hypothetical protein